MLSIFLFIVFFSFLSWLSYKPHRASDQHQHSIGAASATTGPSLTQDTAKVPDTFPKTQKTALKPDYDNSIVQIIDNRTPIPQQPTSIAATEQLPTDMESATEKEPELIRSNSIEPDELVQAARESAHSGDAVASDAVQTPIEELALEVELAPPESASPEEMPPTTPVSETSAEEEEAGISPALTESEASHASVETTSAIAATPEASQENQEGSVPELRRPLPPDPELVEAAISDALEKSQDFSPPESADT